MLSYTTPARAIVTPTDGNEVQASELLHCFTSFGVKRGFHAAAARSQRASGSGSGQVDRLPVGLFNVATQRQEPGDCAAPGGAGWPRRRESALHKRQPR